jgi:flavin reductase
VLLAGTKPEAGARHLKESEMISTTDFRNGMALLAGAVNVITTDGPAGLAGFTASAVCSVTDQPPTILVCMNRSSFAHQFFVENRVLCVNVLSSTQERHSQLFSNRNVAMSERFATVPWQVLDTGAPALDGALVNFDAEIVQIHEVGTHSIFYAELRRVRLLEESDGGLAYFNRAYHRLGGRHAA